MLLWVGLLLGMTVGSRAGTEVQLVRTPQGGIQPQALVDPDGTLHLLYYKGDPRHGDLFYVRQRAGQAEPSQPVQVNSTPGSAIAVGTIRGGQLAVGRHGRVYVIWNGSDQAPNAPTHEWGGVIYTRLNDAGTRFEPEHDLITTTTGVDGGSSVAADSQGHVYVTWHAAPAGNTNGEPARTVYLRVSNDDGKTFAAERPVGPGALGACACCGMRTGAGEHGLVYILYRIATAVTNRDEVLLLSHNYGKSFVLANQSPWITGSCPMSSASLSSTADGALAAWETAGQVYYGKLDGRSGRLSMPHAAPGDKRNRKHPAVVGNRRGEVLLVWTEGTGWEKGGSLAWQVFDGQGHPTQEKGKADGVPVWGLPTAYAKPDGGFVIVY